MGATRKLAMIVVVCLIAVATAVTVYTANEPNRRASETTVQEDVSVERGTSLYITYCLQCHGPAGLGLTEVDANGESTGRTGQPLNQALLDDKTLAGKPAIFQSDDPVEQSFAEAWIRFRIIYGSPSEGQLNRNYNLVPAMPSFRHDLNVEEVNSLVWLIMHGDWNYVYNTAVHQTGQQVCESTPEADRTDVCLGDMSNAVAYPTAPVASEATEAADEPQEDTQKDEGEADAPAGAAVDHQVIATDNAFDTDAITVKPGDTITLTNNGFAQHDIAVEGLGIETDLLNNGETMTITIPEDAAAGEYTFYCTVPGHRESGMVGTITVEVP